MKSFVTGATGFLGSHLVDLLLREGHEVRCLVRPTSDLRWLEEKPIQKVVGSLDASDPHFLKGLEGIDWFFHCAGLISTAFPKEYWNVNVEGTRHALKACLSATPSLKRFVYISSIAACGPSLNGLPVTESTPEHPITEYGRSKFEGEKILQGYGDTVPFSILRPPGIYGPRDTAILPIFKMAKKGIYLLPGLLKRFISLVYVEDVVRAALWAAISPKAVGEVLFISDGTSHPWGEIADTLAKIFHKKIFKIPVPKTPLVGLALLEEIRAKIFGGRLWIHRGHICQFFQRSWGISIEKIRKAGWEPSYNLQEGMERTVSGYKELGWL